MFVDKKLYYVVAFSLCVLLGFLLPSNVYATNTFSGWIGNCSTGTHCDPINTVTTQFCSDCVALTTPGSGPGQFNYPNATAVDPSGNIYVTDTGNNRVEKFNSAGVYQSQIGCASGACTTGSGSSQFFGPQGIAIDSSGNNIYVLDQGNNRIEKFNSAGVYQSQIGCASGACTPGYANGQFFYPLSIAVDPSGNVYVGDTINNRVQKFDSSGNFIQQLGCTSGACTTGSGPGQFMVPRGIAVDSSGNVYVEDSNNNRVQKFDSSGNFIQQLGCTSGACIAGSGNGQFIIPRGGIAVDSSGNIYVGDTGNNRVEAFNSAGVYQSQLGCTSGACTPGSANGQFMIPAGIAVDSSGNIYVADAGFLVSNNRVQKFSAPAVSHSYELQVSDTNGDCELLTGLPASTSWNSATSTCTIYQTPMNVGGDTITIDSGVTLEISSAGFFTNFPSSIINNYGTILNQGIVPSSFDNQGVIYNHGVINNHSYMTNDNGGEIDNYAGAMITIDGGTITVGGTPSLTNNNGATIVNHGIINYNTITNNSGGTITNDGTINSSEFYGNLYNYGTINNISRGAMTNQQGSVIYNYAGANLNNSGTMTNIDSATMYNYGIFTNNSGGTINNTFHIANANGGIMNNSGTININGGAIYNTNTSIINNNSGGIIDNTSVGVINNDSGGTINNYGAITNAGGVANNGAINEYCGASITGSGVISGTQPVNACNPPNPVTILTMSANATTVTQGHRINFTYFEQNTGNVPLTSSQVGDAACPGGYAYSHNVGGFNEGDLNQNNILDPGETWVFQCVIQENTVGTFIEYGRGLADYPPGTMLGPSGSEEASLSFTVNPVTVTTGQGTVTFSTSNGILEFVYPFGQAGLQAPDGTYPYGFFTWTILVVPNACTQIEMSFPNPVPAGSQWIKMIGGQPVIVPITINGDTITMTICDNQVGDANPTLGVISDPGGLAIPTDSRVSGAGNIAKNIDFSFAVRSDSNAKHPTTGTLDYEDTSAKIKLHSDGILFLSVNPTTTGATFIGKGDLDKHKGDVNILASMTDPDKKGEHDTFSITITDSTGKILYTNSGTVKGHIEIHKFADHDDKSDSGISH